MFNSEGKEKDGQPGFFPGIGNTISWVSNGYSFLLILWSVHETYIVFAYVMYFTLKKTKKEFKD